MKKVKKIALKNDEVQFLKRNWSTLKESANAMVGETLDFVMTSVEKDLDMIVERANKTILGVNSWMKKQRDSMEKVYRKKEEELEKEIEMSRMADEGGAGFINTLPHDASPVETSNAPDLH